MMSEFLYNIMDFYSLDTTDLVKWSSEILNLWKYNTESTQENSKKNLVKLIQLLKVISTNKIK